MGNEDNHKEGEESLLPPRTFTIMNSEKNKRTFTSNYITTSKYTALSFFPKALILQFKRYANLYFLMKAIL
jgi:hypothetical protein